MFYFAQDNFQARSNFFASYQNFWAKTDTETICIFGPNQNVLLLF